MSDYLNRIFNEDIFSGIEKIPNRSIDFIITDLPTVWARPTETIRIGKALRIICAG